ncbi:MAG: hypothetical protein PWQ97_460 [Tepidanaerobacteraceae bacterium]|nr:hypothetical protein [Tepidanaerobacteraceae bacterium]
MQWSLEIYQFAFWLLTTVVSVALAAISYFIKDIRQTIKEKQEKTEKKIEDIGNEFMEFKASLPRNYVLRDDFIRTTATLEAKIDRMAADTTEIKEAIAKLVGGAK